MKHRLLTHALVALISVASLPAWAADIVINNVDAPGVGFNDPRPATSVGGNTGTTIGAQRRKVFEKAAAIWGATLQSDARVVIQATFQPLFCDASSAVLGAAGTIQIFSNFAPNAWQNSWYPAALANKLARADLTPGPFDPGLLQPPYNDDIVAYFNGSLANDPACLGGASWYYGFDHQFDASREIDLLAVLLHELGHGLGFANFVTETSGRGPLGLPDVYSAFTHDNTTGKYWNQMTDKERKASSVNTGNIVWHGPNATAGARDLLYGTPVVRVTAPASLAGDFEAQSASYGVPLTEAGVSGQVVLFTDGAGANPHDACDIVFDPNVAGKIALIPRGGCPFAFKSAVAQLSGAIGVIIFNNQPVGPAPMGGGDLIFPTIPSVGVSLADGTLFAANPGLVATLRRDKALGQAGADESGFPRLYAPNPIEGGSSLSHWDTTASPNLLMEPFINADLTGLDLTPLLLQDIGWDGQVHCPVGADFAPTVVVAGCDTGLPNLVGPFVLPLKPITRAGLTSGDIVGGCTLSDVFNGCAGNTNWGDEASCITHITNVLVEVGFIPGRYAGQIQACVSP